MSTTRTIFRPAMFDTVGWLCVAGWIGYAALGTNVFGRREWPSGMVDYYLNYHYAMQIVEQRSYPPLHPYPPPAIIMQYGAAQLPFPISAALYLALIIVAAVSCWYVLRRLLGFHRRPGSTLLLVPAFAICSGPFMWDLRSASNNVLFLLAALLSIRAVMQGRAAQAGFWLALSVALKLFAILLIPYFWWRGQRRAFVWTLAFSLVLWIALPAAVLGLAGARDVYASWVGQLDTIRRQAIDAHPILVSLKKSTAWMSGGSGTVERVTTLAVWGLWLIVAAFAAMAPYRRDDWPDAARGWLADAGLLMLAPVALNPYLEPYHPVALAIPALLLVQGAADARQPARARRMALLLSLLTLAASVAPVPWELRGLRLNLELLVATLGSVMVVSQTYAADRLLFTHVGGPLPADGATPLARR